MSYPDWLKITPKKKGMIHVGKVRPQEIDPGEMAAGSPSAASRKMARIIEQRDATAKILVVGDGVFSAKLADYAIKMGQRLDYEIVALSVFTKCSPKGCGSGESDKNHFLKRAELGAASFAERATFSGIKLHQFAKIGTMENVVAKIVKEVAGIRFVLSEPDIAKLEVYSGLVQLPVIDTTGPEI
jgi:hypothetical protein